MIEKDVWQIGEKISKRRSVSLYPWFLKENTRAHTTVLSISLISKRIHTRQFCLSPWFLKEHTHTTVLSISLISNITHTQHVQFCLSPWFLKLSLLDFLTKRTHAQQSLTEHTHRHSRKKKRRKKKNMDLLRGVQELLNRIFHFPIIQVSPWFLKHFAQS